jgi:CubicO group peptidase (beta-lactamase class C family)
VSERLRAELAGFRERHGVPAVGGALVTGEGLADLEVVGVRVRGGDDPVRLDDRWHIGSCCKSVTAVLYARLVERGDAAWGAPLAELFPDLAGSIDPGWSSVTIDDLFVSQGGLPANLGRGETAAAFRAVRPLRDQRTEATAAALARPPRRPGRFLYSNLGYVVIGAAIERITDEPFESALATHVLGPLGIGSAGFGPPPGLWGHGGRMLGLGPLGFYDLGRVGPADPGAAESDNPPILGPAGRLHLSLEDWAKLQRLFLTEGDGFLLPETIERLLTPGSGRGYRQALGWAPAAFPGVSYGQQGSNTFWVATALIDAGRRRSALVVCNEGRARLLKQTPELAGRLLAGARPEARGAGGAAAGGAGESSSDDADDRPRGSARRRPGQAG